jgi:hypothetical protein
MFYEENYMTALFTLHNLPNRQAAEDLIEEAFLADRIGEAQMDRLHARLGRWFPLNNEGLPVANELGHLANDHQNVHTAQVSAQTRRAMDVLLAIPLPAVITTTYNILEHYLPRVHAQGTSALRSYQDVLAWYERESCVAQNDYLYRNLLDGCVAYINASPHKNELWNRLLEEIDESVGMCCMGHLTRLCNVFTGFDDRFAPPVPVGELLQQKMAAIAAKDIETYQKVEEANAVFDELHVPEDQREAWLEAF